MKLLLWIVFIGLTFVLIADVRPPGVVTDSVDFMELNHVYNDDGAIVLDQIILWDWVEVKIYNKEQGRYEKHTMKRVVLWYLLDKKKYREQLTPEQQRKKNQELGKQWVKKWGDKIPAPDYNPKFLGGPSVPRYDRASRQWIVIFKDRGDIVRKVYAGSFIESWTQYDVEVKNQELFPKESRRKLSTK